MTNDKLEAARTGNWFIGTLTEHSANGEKKELDRDLAGKDLSGADFAEANLTGANLTGADLSEARMINADLVIADLTRANLTRVNLTGADLPENRRTTSRVRFGPPDRDPTCANLSGADLSHIIGADLSGAILK